MAPAPDDLDIALFVSQTEWSAWLDANAGNSAGIWLKSAKKNGGGSSLTYAEAVETALCYGWIDSQIGRFDDRYYLQRFTPRRPSSSWTQANIDKAKQLIASGRMQPSGLAAIEAAKQHSNWQ